MKTNASLGSLIRLLAGIVYGTLVASEVLAYLVMTLRLVSVAFSGDAEEFLYAFLYLALGLIPFLLVLIVFTLLYTLVVGFAQMIDDVHAVREHAVPQEKAPKQATPAVTANRYFGTAPTEKKPSGTAPVKGTPVPKSAPAVAVANKYFGADAVDTSDARLFCPHCGKKTFLDEEDRCEYCKREVHVQVPPRKTAPKVSVEHDNEPRQADCPPDKWFCKACGAQVELSKDKCECGYKRPKTR